MAIESTRDLCLSVADAICEKKGSSDLINPQDFAKEIASIEGGGNGGGGELEGEYFFAKPNGRYWKFTFMPEETRLRIEDFEISQIESMFILYRILFAIKCVYGAAVSTDDASFGYELARLDGFYNIGSGMKKTMTAIRTYKNGGDYSYQDFNEGFLRVWKECDIKSNTPAELDGIVLLSSYNFVEIVKMVCAIMEGESELTDDEAISFIEQAFMLIPATEEEYKRWRFEDEDY